MNQPFSDTRRPVVKPVARPRPRDVLPVAPAAEPRRRSRGLAGPAAIAAAVTAVAIFAWPREAGQVADGSARVEPTPRVLDVAVQDAGLPVADASRESRQANLLLGGMPSTLTWIEQTAQDEGAARLDVEVGQEEVRPAQVRKSDASSDAITSDDALQMLRDLFGEDDVLHDDAQVGMHDGARYVPAPTPAATPAADEADLVSAGELLEGMIRVTVNDSRVIKTKSPYYRVSVGRPEVADVQPLSPDTLLVSARGLGTTQLVLWDADDRTQTLMLQSGGDLREVREKFEELLPGEQIEVVDLRDRVALRGRVSDLVVADKAQEIASAYAPVVNFLEIAGNQQVMLEIRFAEVSRSAAKQLGVNFAFADGTSVGGSTVGGVNPIGPGTGGSPNANVNGIYNVPSTLGGAVSVFGGGTAGQTAFNFFLSALRDNNLLRVLAEPNLVVISGEQGEFLAGGEIPIPVPQERNVTIEYREFGVRLRYLPIVLGDGRIRLKIEPEVSDLDFSTGVSVAGISVPGLRKRSISTTIELMDGQTFAVAGLIDSSIVANKQVTPILGDVPVLGTLFRSTRYQRRETELVVLVTPRLVSPLDPDEVPALPGDGWKHPNEWELHLMGQMGGEDNVARPAGTDPAGRGSSTRP